MFVKPTNFCVCVWDGPVERVCVSVFLPVRLVILRGLKGLLEIPIKTQRGNKKTKELLFFYFITNHAKDLVVHTGH